MTCRYILLTLSSRGRSFKILIKYNLFTLSWWIILLELYVRNLCLTHIHGFSSMFSINFIVLGFTFDLQLILNKFLYMVWSRNWNSSWMFQHPICWKDFLLCWKSSGCPYMSGSVSQLSILFPRSTCLYLYWYYIVLISVVSC